MKSTVVDESLSSMNQQFCSRENQLLQLLQQNEKSMYAYSMSMINVNMNAVSREPVTMPMVHILIDGKDILPYAL